MDWFLYGKSIHDERIKIRNEQLLKNFEKHGQRLLNYNFLF